MSDISGLLMKIATDDQEPGLLDLDAQLDWFHRHDIDDTLFRRARQFAVIRTGVPWEPFPARYMPADHEVVLPPPRVFVNQLFSVSVLMHELAHWTMAKHLCNRDNGIMGEPIWWREELVAECSSMKMLEHFGYPKADHTDDYLRMAFRKTTGLPALQTIEYVEHKVECAVECLIEQFNRHPTPERTYDAYGTAAGRHSEWLRALGSIQGPE